MGALDDLLLSQQPSYSGDNSDLLPPAAPASAPLSNFDTAPAAAPSPLDFLSVDQRLGTDFATSVTPPATPTVPQAQESLGLGASLLTHQDPWGPSMPTAEATPISSYPITETFRETPGEYGVDLATPVGTPIRAPWGGVIAWEQSGKKNWGNRVFVKGQNGWTFAVGHLSRFAVPNGATVKPGQVIGYSGGATNDPNSGNSTGPHIEPQLISPLGYYIDPLPWLRKVWGQGPASGLNPAAVAGPQVGGGVTAKANANQPAVPASNALDPRAALVAAERPQTYTGRGLTQTLPSGGSGNPLDILGGRSLGDVLGAPSAIASGLVHGLRPATEGGLAGPVGDIGRAVLGTWKTDPNDPRVAGFYEQNRGPDWPTFQNLNPAQRQQIAQGYQEEMMRRFADFNPLDVIGAAVAGLPGAPYVLYSLGNGKRDYGDYDTATLQQRQAAMQTGTDMINFATMGSLTPDAALGRIASAPARAALLERLNALKAQAQNQLSDTTGINGLAVGEQQLPLPGVLTKAPPIPADAPKFDAATLQAVPAPAHLAAEKAGQLSIPTRAEVKAKAAQLGAPGLFDDLKIPPTPVAPSGPYHGTSTPIAKLGHTYDRPQSQNLYGPGFYVSDNLAVARQYAATKGTGATRPVYAVSWAGERPPQLLDLEKPLPQDAFNAITRDLHPSDSQKMGLTYRPNNMAGAPPGSMVTHPGREVYRRTIDALHDIIVDERPEESRWAMDEHMHDIVDRLVGLGYDGFSYQGGRLTRKEPHTATVFFKPVNDAGVANLRLAEVTPGARPAAGGMGFLGAGDLQAAYDALAPRVAPVVRAAAGKTFDLAKDFDQPAQGLKETVAALRAGLWGGKVNEAHQALDQLASSPPEQQQAVALNAVMRMHADLAQLYDRQTAGEDVSAEIAKQETLLATYSKAARDVVSGWSHPLGPTMRNLIDAVMHPYTLKRDILGGDAIPRDPVLAIRYQGGMRNAVFNLGDMLRRYLNKNLKTPQQWDDLAWEMEQGNKFQNRQLETRAVGPGAPVLRVAPKAGGGLRQAPTGEFQNQRIIPPDIKALATLLRASNDAMGIYLTEYRKGEFFQAMRDNFWSRKVIGYRDPATGKAIYKAELSRFRAGPGRGLQLSPDSPHFQPRTMQEGLDQLENAGWIVVKNPAQNVPEYWNAVAQAVANKNILDILKTSFASRDGRPIAIAGNAGVRPAGAEGYHHVLPNLNAWVHPDAWKMIESQFDTSLPGKGREMALAFGEVFRQVNMINPLVHTINQMSHQLFQTLIPLRLWILGHQLAKDPGVVREASVYTYIRPRRAATEYSEAMKGISRPGPVNPFAPGYQEGTQGMNLAQASGHVALDTALLPLREAVDAGHTFLFEFVIRNAQMAMYALEKEKLLKMGLDPEQARLMAGIRADRLVGAIDPTTKGTFERKWASLIFFAYNWSKTHVMQALESTPALGRQVLAKEHPYLTKQSLRYLEEEMTWSAFRGITTALFYSNAINLLLSGHPMWQNDPGRELDWDYTQFARDHLGYTGTQNLYIDAMPMRWINFFFQPLQAYRRQGENSPGAVVGAATDWGQTKLMPPLTTILSYMNDKDPNLTAKALRAVETSIPLQRQLTALTGDSVLGPQTIGDIQKAINDIHTGMQPGGLMSPEAQRFLQNLSAFAAGENPIKKGPVQNIPAERQVGYVQAQFDRRVALELATNQHLGWATAGELAKEKAKKAVLARPDGGEAEAQRQEDHFRQLQVRAIAELAQEHNDTNLDQVDLSPAAQQKMQANNQNPMDLLDNFEKAKLFAKYPELSLYHEAPDLSPDARVRAVKNQTAVYHVRVAEQLQIARAQQEQADAQLRQGTMSFQSWRDQRTQLLRSLYDKDVGSVTSLARQLPDALTTKDAYDAFQKQNGAPVGTTTARDLAFNAYKAIQLDDPKFTLPDGSLDALAWKAERDQLLSSLPKEEQDYVKLKEQSSWTDVEFLYHQLANRYLAFEQEHADAVHLYHQMFQVTNTVQARKQFETQHPEILRYTVARNAFLRQNPLVAEAFAHGSILARALATHGVSPNLTPSQQIAKLLLRPQPGLDLNRPDGGTTQAQLQQEFDQNFGVAPPAQALPGGTHAVDLASLLASLQQPGAGAQPSQTDQKGPLAASLYQ